MGNLKQDIEAISKLDCGLPAPAAQIVLVTDKNQVSIPISVGDYQHVPLKSHFKDILSSFPENARIPIVVSMTTQIHHWIAYRNAACDFCEVKVAGILILMPSHHVEEKGFAAGVSDFFENLPKDFLTSAMLVFHDETDMLPAFMPNSQPAEYDSHLTFEDPSKALGRAFAHSGHYLGGNDKFPVYNATGTSDEAAVLETLSWNTCRNVLQRSHRILNHAIGFPPRVALNLSLKDLAIILDEVFPDTVNPSVFDEVKWRPVADPGKPIENIVHRKYAVMLDTDHVGRIIREETEVKKIDAVIDIVKSSFEENNRKMVVSTESNLDASMIRFKELCEALGIHHKIEAWKSGVPVEDVIA